MQGMDLIQKNIKFFLKRKHKLYRALSQNPSDYPLNLEDAQHHIVSLYSALINKENQISQIDYFIKHEFDCCLPDCIDRVFNIIWQLLTIRSGSFIAFVVYRLCRKYPNTYWAFFELIKNKFVESQKHSLEEIVFLTDICLYGFPFTFEEFTDKIFPSFQPFILDLIPKYFYVFQQNNIFPLRLQKQFKLSFQLWMEKERTKIIQSFHQLLQKGQQLQQKLIVEKQNECQQTKYVTLSEQYQMKLYKFANSIIMINQQFQVSEYKLKSIFQLKKQCQTFTPKTILSEYQQSLYQHKQQPKQLKCYKKSQMTKLDDNQCFITQIKLCSNIQQCYNLSGFFLQQMNIQSNRQKLIQVVINDCYNYNNLSYIIKILAEIGQIEQTMKEYCGVKGKKICGQMRMNMKYQRLLCEMVRFGLIDQNIILDYIDKILKYQNSQVTKEAQSILQHLGKIIYNRSLATHIRFNAIFQRIENIIKNKMMQFNIEHLINIKSLRKYLQLETNRTNNDMTHQMAKLQIKNNFEFIQKKMIKLLKQNQLDSITQYVLEGIEHQEYLTSYYYASLLRDLKSKELNKIIHQKTVDIIHSNIKLENSQASVRWSRFLGELYNYQTIKRKMLVQDLMLILQQNQIKQMIGTIIKSLCAAIQTSKSFLRESQMRKDGKQVITLLLQLKIVLLKHKQDMQPCTCCQLQDILEYFHPQLVIQLQSESQIKEFIKLTKQQSNKKTNSPYFYLDQLGKGKTMSDLNEPSSPELKKNYREKKVQSGWVEKSTKYVQKSRQTVKVEHSEQSKKEITNQEMIKISQTVTTIKQVTQTPVVKKMKVMGRSKADKSIKIVSCAYTQFIPKE